MNGSGRLVASRPRMVIAAVFATLMGAGAVSAAGPESPAVTRMLGSGVHAYFSGDFLRSYEDLSAAVEAGSQDPRVLYFRGLSALRLGRFDEAEADFSRGADLEADTSANWPVPQALERVQGCDRLRLERHRARARVARLQDDVARERKRYSGIMDRQDEVLRDRRPAPAARGGEAAGNLFEPGGEAAPVVPPQAPAPEALPTPPGPQPPAEAETDMGSAQDAAADGGMAADSNAGPGAGGAAAEDDVDAATESDGATESAADGAAVDGEPQPPEGGMSDGNGNAGPDAEMPADGGMDGADSGMDGAAGEGGAPAEDAGSQTEGQ